MVIDQGRRDNECVVSILGLRGAMSRRNVVTSKCAGLSEMYTVQSFTYQVLLPRPSVFSVSLDHTLALQVFCKVSPAVSKAPHSHLLLPFVQ